MAKGQEEDEYTFDAVAVHLQKRKQRKPCNSSEIEQQECPNQK